MVTIATREKSEILEELKKQGKKFYSISKADTIEQCHYQAYLAYVKHEKSMPNIYALMGSRIHDTLEAIMNGEQQEKSLIPALQCELNDLDMLGFDFPRDRRGGTSIRDAWIKNMEHFCKTFIAPKGKFATEQLFIYPLTNNRIVRGYIDLVQFHSDGTISIWDWKTSSQFSKDTLLEHGRQLVMYAIAKEYEGYKVRNIGWIMLKYVEISFNGKLRKNSKNKVPISKVCDRYKIAETIKPYVEQELADAGYDDLDIEIYLHEVMKTNSLECLPEKIKEKFHIKPYVRKYEITDELKQETLNYINQQADIFEALPQENAMEWKPKEINAKSEFFCNYLCDYKKVCEYIQKYNKEKDMQKLADEDLF